MSQRAHQQSKREQSREAMARGVIQSNTHLNFVQRLLNPDAWPNIANPDGSYSSHRMSWSNDDIGPFVYPTVVYDEATNSMKQLDGREGAQHAIRTGELIRMPSDEDADWFSNHGYKLSSGMERQMGSGGLAPGPRMLEQADVQAPNPNSGEMPMPMFNLRLGGFDATPVPARRARGLGGLSK